MTSGRAGIDIEGIADSGRGERVGIGSIVGSWLSVGISLGSGLAAGAGAADADVEAPVEAGVGAEGMVELDGDGIDEAAALLVAGAGTGAS